MISVRPYRPTDRAACAGVFFRAVREGTAEVYSLKQRMDWAGEPDPDLSTPDLSTPDPRQGQDTWISEENGQITGFMAMDKTGCLDMAFVLPEVMGKGHAAAIYDVLLAHAKATGLTQLTVQASHFSQRFLAKRGWRLDSVKDFGVKDFGQPGGVIDERFLMSLDVA
jgi:putative acetyltransferase